MRGIKLMETLTKSTTFTAYWRF